MKLYDLAVVKWEDASPEIGVFMGWNGKDVLVAIVGVGEHRPRIEELPPDIVFEIGDDLTEFDPE